jgi:hypothetical protein
MAKVHHVIPTLFLVAAAIPWYMYLWSYETTSAEYQQRPPVHLIATIPTTTTWIGDAWILPPRLRMFGPMEIRNYFHSHSVLVIGDREVARVHYGTLVEILRDPSNHPSKNKLANSTQLDRTYVADGSSCQSHNFSRMWRMNGICREFLKQRIDFLQLECFREVSDFVRSHAITFPGTYDAVVLATGRLETAVQAQRRRCETYATREFPKGAIVRMEELMVQLEELSVPVIWRNGGFNREQQHEYVQLIDQYVENRLQRSSSCHVQLIDYASAVQERAYARIPSERALLFIELLMNALVAYPLTGNINVRSSE